MVALGPLKHLWIGFRSYSIFFLVAVGVCLINVYLRFCQDGPWSTTVCIYLPGYCSRVYFYCFPYFPICSHVLIQSNWKKLSKFVKNIIILISSNIIVYHCSKIHLEITQNISQTKTFFHQSNQFFLKIPDNFFIALFLLFVGILSVSSPR